MQRRRPPAPRALVGLCALLAAPAHARTFVVANNCPFTIWPAIFTDLDVGSSVPAFPTGWEAAAFSAVSFAVPDDWTAGRIWGRRDCDFSTNATAPSTCLTGGCTGGLLCDARAGTGVPPATVAEWTLRGAGGADFYDVSLVDGYNLPMRIAPAAAAGCAVAECAVDLGPICPDALKGPFDAAGFPVGCRSACGADLDGDQGSSPNCCSGAFDSAAACPSTGVAYYAFFKGNCPRAYAYAFDEGSGSALWACAGAAAADYTLTFCPPPAGLPAPAPAAASDPAASAPAAGPPAEPPNAPATGRARRAAPRARWALAGAAVLGWAGGAAG